MRKQFPDDFLWGTATSSFQIEGAATPDERGESIWDRLCETPGKVAKGATGKVACDHVNRYREDVALMKSLGVKSYRFSLSWPRLFPECDKSHSAKGLDFYNRLIDELVDAGIEPAITLFHWDLPQRLEDEFGGWTSREVAKRLGDFSAWAGKQFGDRVKRFFTTNEFYCFTERGYGIGEFAPGRVESDKVRNQARHNGLLGHGYALQGLRSCGHKVQAGVVDNVITHVPVIETEENIAAAREAFRHENAPYMTALMEGRYLESYVESQGDAMPEVQDGDFDIISAPMDFIGYNLYTGEYVQACDNKLGYEVLDMPEGYPTMKAPWIKVLPSVMYWSARYTKECWSDLPIYIAENGCGQHDVMNDHAKVMDVDRVFYLREYLSHMHRAIEEGYNVSGYYLWSLMDNFEWCDGYDTRFGMVYTDFESQERTPKLSSEFYSEVIRGNALV